MKIERLDPSRYDVASNVLARAFQDDPMFRYVFADPDERAEQLEWTFHRWVRVVAPIGASFITSGGEGVALWLPASHSPHVGFWRQLRQGLGAAPFRMKLWQLPRAWRLQSDANERHRAMLHPHWQLNTLAVHPVHQRCGAGSLLLRHMLARVDLEGLPTYLITHNPGNVLYYERFGFSVVQRREPRNSTDFFASTLCREPHAVPRPRTK